MNIEGSGYHDSTVARDVLACSVRGCRKPLRRTSQTLVCARGHSHDIARAGYVNLLQPQDRRSPDAGDAAEALAARARLLAAGIGLTLVQRVVHIATRVAMSHEAVVVDLGAGSGDVLGELAACRSISGIGIDLSAAGMKTASKRFPSLTWIVANADRQLPILDESVDLVLSVNARRNPAECARVLTRPGHLLTVVPAADDLIELRAVVQGRGVERNRADAVIAEHLSYFTLREQTTVRERQTLTRDQLLDVLGGTYRGARKSAARGVEALTSLDVTFASELMLFAAR